MFYVYLLSSKVKNWVYVGITSNLDERVKRHNTGRERITKPYRPFELIFAQQFESRTKARELEKFLKIRFNKEAILDLITGLPAQAGVVEW